MQRDDAAAALAAVDAARSQLADITGVPAWRHVLFGLLEGLVVAGVGLGNGWTSKIYAAVLGLAIVMYFCKRATMGIMVNAFRHGPKRIVAVALVLLLAVACGLNRHLLAVQAPLEARLLVAAAAGIMAALASVFAHRRYVADLRNRIGQ